MYYLLYSVFVLSLTKISMQDEVRLCTNQLDRLAEIFQGFLCEITNIREIF